MLNESTEPVQSAETENPDTPYPASRPSNRLSGSGCFAWLVTIGISILLMILAASKDRPVEDDPNVPPGISATERIHLVYLGKQIVYPKLMDEKQDEKKEPPDEASVSNLLPRLKGLDQGTLTQRWFYAILLNELKGASAAREHLKLTRQRLEEASLKPTEQQNKIHQLLYQLLGQYEQEDFTQEALTEDDKELLRSELGWYGDLVLAPRESSNLEARKSLAQQAESAIYMTFGAALLGIFVLFVGFVVLVASTIFAAVKWIKPKFTTNDSNHNIYIETFAVWLVIFVGGQILMGLLLTPADATNGIQRIAWGIIPFVGSLVALYWPVLRGISIQQLFSDIGWKWGNPFVEVGSAIQIYLATLPLLFAAVVFFGIMMTLMPDSPPTDFSGRDLANHPIQEEIGKGGKWVVGIVLLMTAFAAPLVEETMFRGVLYRHLRNWSRGMARFLSVVGSMLLNSFIFAAIHPQGLLAIPMLMALAIGFTITREYRDSLVAPMLMHGIHNFLVMMFSLWMVN